MKTLAAALGTVLAASGALYVSSEVLPRPEPVETPQAASASLVKPVPIVTPNDPDVVYCRKVLARMRPTLPNTNGWRIDCTGHVSSKHSNATHFGDSLGGITMSDRKQVLINAHMTTFDIEDVIRHEVTHIITRSDHRVVDRLAETLHIHPSKVFGTLPYETNPAEVLAAANTRCTGNEASPGIEHRLLTCEQVRYIMTGVTK